MIFARTKRTAQKVADDLTERGFAAAAVHGDLGQGAREKALRAFRTGKVDVLVATDVAARGIDIDDVTHVINYQCPEDEKTYVHRIGRTGRAGREGVAVTFVDWDETNRWKSINDAARPGPARAGGDVLHVRPPVRRPGHPVGFHRAAAAEPPHPGRSGRGDRGEAGPQGAAQAQAHRQSFRRTHERRAGGGP